MPYLEFSDERQQKWRVWDTSPRTFTDVEWPAYAVGWLTFECIDCDPPEEKRRLVPAPEGWHEGDETALRRLLELAEVITPAPATGGGSP